jgi:hypothetical protein
MDEQGQTIIAARPLFFTRGKDGLATFRLRVLPSAIILRRFIRGTLTRSAACQTLPPSQKPFRALFISSAVNGPMHTFEAGQLLGTPSPPQPPQSRPCVLCSVLPKSMLIPQF